MCAPLPTMETSMTTKKTVIDGIDGFKKLIGQQIGPSEPVRVTQERIEAFCHAVDNDDWIHFDKERCVSQGFGNTIDPGLLNQDYFYTIWFAMVDMCNNKRMIILGSEQV